MRTVFVVGRIPPRRHDPRRVERLRRTCAALYRRMLARAGRPDAKAAARDYDDARRRLAEAERRS